MRVTIDKAGRVVIPKKIRDDLGLVAGTELELERDGAKVSLEVPATGRRMYRKNGILVFAGTGRLTVEDVTRVQDDIEAERIRDLAGDLA